MCLELFVFCANEYVFMITISLLVSGLPNQYCGNSDNCYLHQNPSIEAYSNVSGVHERSSKLSAEEYSG